MTGATAISLDQAFEKLSFLPDRRPDTNAVGWFSQLAAYRDGAIFIVHYAGYGEWERHFKADEIVFVVEGETTLVMLVDAYELRTPLQQGQLVVVPQNTWHRFESPTPVKVLTVTPQPTDHSADRPQ
jgi:mannose-6-phosphate isomerase-like protein (cupin superfamily)